MLPILLIAVIVALLLGLWKLNQPWRTYHKANIAPIEQELEAERKRHLEATTKQERAQANADLFTRNFQAEVRGFQKAKNKAFEELNPLRDQKFALHEELDEVRASLYHWHRKSASGLFGNKGRKIKNNSVLGWLGLEQTIAQKYSLENKRDTISGEINKLNSTISEIYEDQIKLAKDGIIRAFEDKKRLMRFRQDGLDVKHFQDEVRSLDSLLRKTERRIKELQARVKDLKQAYREIVA
ncbi:MAG: hypothetical protein AAGA87_14865 [Pseudomonadota bacterium]